jgi:hypothetical protein
MARCTPMSQRGSVMSSAFSMSTCVLPVGDRWRRRQRSRPPRAATRRSSVIEMPDGVTSQSRHSLLLQGSPPSGKLLIPLNRRDVRVVEGARLESDSGEAQRDTPKQLLAQSSQRHPATRCVSMRTRKQGWSSATSKRPYTVFTQFRISLARVRTDVRRCASTRRARTGRVKRA